MSSAGNTARIGLLALALVLAIGTIGVVYTLWSSTLSITATVQTGSVDARWSAAFCSDLEAETDVGYTAASIEPSDPAHLVFNIVNGYPSYTGNCQVEYRYLGSVPAKVDSISLIPGSALTGCEVAQSPTTGSLTATCDQLTVRWIDGLCTQLHRGDELAGALRVHVEDKAEQALSYTFTLRVRLVQWNQSACP
jgi:hypothetical protein